MKIKELLFKPIFENNPIALQILGICSALAVTSSLKVTVVMCIAVILVTAFSNFLYPWSGTMYRAVFVLLYK